MNKKSICNQTLLKNKFYLIIFATILIVTISIFSQNHQKNDTKPLPNDDMFAKYNSVKNQSIKLSDFAKIIPKPKNFLLERSKNFNNKSLSENYIISKNKDSILCARDKKLPYSIFLPIYNDSELTIFNEIFISKIYDFSKKNDKKYVCFDIGLNVGMASIFYAKKEEISQIYSFEPFVQNFYRVYENFELNKIPENKVHVFGFGLSNINKEVEANYKTDYPGGSFVNLKQENLPPEKNNEKEKILLKKASDILPSLASIHKDENIILKIDCEGSEFEIIPDLNKCGFLEKVDEIIMEIHTCFANLSKTKEIKNIIEKMGFKTQITGDINYICTLKASKIK